MVIIARLALTRRCEPPRGRLYPPAVLRPVRSRSPLRWGALLIALGLPALAFAWPVPSTTGLFIDHRAFAAGPVDARRVYWVGHSLMNGRDPHVPGAQNLMEKVGALAEARGLAYRSFDHTLWGSPLSLLYRGAPHSFERSAPEMRERRRELANSRYDAMVLTEALPVRVTREHEHTAYYLARFACDFQQRNPEGRVYLFESWTSFQSANPADGLGSPAGWKWADRLREDRAVHEAIADRASAGAALEPGWAGRLTRWVREPTCRPAKPIFLVPVGTVLARLAERSEGLSMADLFANPYVEWPAGWPRDDLEEEEARRVLATLPRRHPEADVDDVHASDLGVYVAALVHFAVLYRQSPEGLPPLAEGLDARTAARLQRLVWDIVRNDPRTGVSYP